jgi:hypothetical protein
MAETPRAVGLWVLSGQSAFFSPSSLTHLVAFFARRALQAVVVRLAFWDQTRVGLLFEAMCGPCGHAVLSKHWWLMCGSLFGRVAEDMYAVLVSAGELRPMKPPEALWYTNRKTKVFGGFYMRASNFMD